jgi:hypothetical protein
VTVIVDSNPAWVSVTGCVSTPAVKGSLVSGSPAGVRLEADLDRAAEAGDGVIARVLGGELDPEGNTYLLHADRAAGRGLDLEVGRARPP